MKKFVVTHGYDPTSYKIKKPLTTAVYKDIVDPKTFELCSSTTHLI